MLIKLINHNKKYEIECMCMLFFQGEKVSLWEKGLEKDEKIVVISHLMDKKSFYICKTTVKIGDTITKAICKSSDMDEKSLKAVLKRSFYKAASKQVDTVLPWGLITGIRPAKIAQRLILEGKDEKRVKQILKSKYALLNEKIDLCFQAAKKSIEALKMNKENSVSLYISIPFCPSRCKYCSFVSHAVEKAKHLIDPYLEALLQELEKTKSIIDEKGLALETIYIGGGTPSILNPLQLRKLMDGLNRAFDLKKIKEITFEAGRADTIDEEKLKIIKTLPNIRISINPQTLNDEVLIEIGRNHTADEFLKAYQLAKKIGFQNINVDVIIGLPKDNLESFKDTMNRIIALEPSNITVHSLSVKRSATFTKEGKAQNFEQDEEATFMLRYAIHTLRKEGYFPYYLYRQRNTIGNLENIGFSKNGFEGLYNIFMMEELHTVFGVGAGAVTKLVNQQNNQIERIFNPKYPYEYIDRMDNVLANKKQVEDFYAKS